MGARDSLRLDAGLCLYGHDIDESTTPIAAGLTWSIAKTRRQGDKQGGFLGADVVLSEITKGCPRRRIGFVSQGKAPVREGAIIVTAEGSEVGTVTSGGFSPSVARPVMMAYVDSDIVASKTPCFASLRGKSQPLSYQKLPFVEHKYYK